jgi:putative chitinase
MSYIDTLSETQKKNSELIVRAAMQAGITNKFTIAAILAIISKESEFKPKSENLNYSVKRIKEVFPSLGNKANELGNNPEGLANSIYGGRYGNALNEGYKYRGRGYNQLTFKGNYDKFGKIIGVNISKNPDLVNEPEIAAKVAIAFFEDGINALKKNGKLKEYNATNINDFGNLTDAILAIYHVNAGTGNKVSKIKNLQNTDILGGYTKAKQRIESIYNDLRSIVKQAAGDITETVNKTVKETGQSITDTVKSATNILPILVIGVIVAYFIFEKQKQ